MAYLFVTIFVRLVWVWGKHICFIICQVYIISVNSNKFRFTYYVNCILIDWLIVKYFHNAFVIVLLLLIAVIYVNTYFSINLAKLLNTTLSLNLHWRFVLSLIVCNLIYIKGILLVLLLMQGHVAKLNYFLNALIFHNFQNSYTLLCEILIQVGWDCIWGSDI